MKRKLDSASNVQWNERKKILFLREQMKAIQKELGDKEGKTGEVSSLMSKIEESSMPDSVRETALKELNRYEKKFLQALRRALSFEIILIG
ncbi:hypothetical protein BsIDN1_48960 [Bacillus safensis]|uniref:Uncharacterized protein n=1 Tax=Bacillus safensis TaxID=561879 RepID=A0A5S9ME54_BACIA|nr:hypothetical protein BsIDN1_48960 [Bacillus safensis]